ncbi:hypothetical protein A2973_01535 [Candidatus Gottesmanbacteria bacterium RIFCSPLOWO2_01_FULL_49_10]|uniref:Methyltransferase domain-containing protein n=1 Tax=Candidatus Gottesmanbacteria bacterium RIFCSPLOWO2_01_FULL_49_10 TaxID=1798396 RepID=A0A1F6B1A0_9BACT|nr:MAG: hypothetical protein A2973_01535 [Candidatus Gottesmanbacteria bacterium RIFCSPLOWO2_01_FULL_49_10]
MKPTPHTFLPDEDLSEVQASLTMQTYDRFAREYADQWEWNPITIREVEKYNIRPFVQYAKPGGTILVAECQSGRDYQALTEKGFRCLGVGFSYGLLVEAVRRVPGGLFIRQDIRSLPFMPESFDGIYADAMIMVPKRDMGALLKDYHIFLRAGGILYLSLKLGQENVLLLGDLGGPRYSTLYREQEIKTMVEKSGFTLVWQAVSPNTDPTLPQWFSLIAKKL